MGRKMGLISSLSGIAMFLFLLTAFVPDAAAQSVADLEEQMRVQIKKAQKTLSGTTWTVYTTLEQAGVKKPEEGTETLTFSDRRVTTQNLANLGYGIDGSNYSVRYEGDTLVWETMQKYKDGEGEALLRGDLKNDVMVGVIDIQPAKGKGQRKVYRFTSQKEKPKPVAKRTTPEEAAAITAKEAAGETTTTTTTITDVQNKKKKDGWW